MSSSSEQSIPVATLSVPQNEATAADASPNSKKQTGSGTKEDPWMYIDEYGISYLWDNENKIWKSKEDLDTLIAAQQSAYVILSKQEQNKPKEVDEEKKKRKKEKKKQRNKMKNNSGVYVTGLPPDITQDEFVDFMSKCGVPKKNPEDPTQVKCKIYRDEQGMAKGDALLVYFKPESVPLAIQILDTVEIKPGFHVKVEQATYEQKTQAKENSQPKKKSKKFKIYNQEKELGWEEEESLYIVLKNMFDPKDAGENPNFYQELKEDIQAECEKLGPIEKVKVFEGNPEGVVVVIFEEFEPAKKCIEVMNGRWFAGKQIFAAYYDGWTNYKVDKIIDENEEKKEIGRLWQLVGAARITICYHTKYCASLSHNRKSQINVLIS